MFFTKIKDVNQVNPPALQGLALAYGKHKDRLKVVSRLHAVFVRGRGQGDFLRSLQFNYEPNIGVESQMIDVSNFVKELVKHVPAEGNHTYTVLMRSKGTVEGHEFYLLKHSRTEIDEKHYSTLVDDFNRYKIPGVEDLMVQKGFDVVYVSNVG